MGRLNADEHGNVSNSHSSEAVTDFDAVKRPALCGLFDQPGHHALGHRLIGFIVERADGPTVFVSAHDAHEFHRGAAVDINGSSMPL